MSEFKMTTNGNKIICNKEVYFYDCGEVARTVSKIYGEILPIDGFISENADDWGTTTNGLKVTSLKNLPDVEKIFIVVATNRNLKKIYGNLQNAGLVPKKNFCHYKEWIRKYFEAVFESRGKLMQDYVELYITDRCSLKCKSCILFAPRSVPQLDRNFEDVAHDIELYFKFVDEVAVFRLMGGEPFLYNNLEDLLKILNGGYRKKIENLILVSNGTIIPSRKILKLLSELNISVHVSDYPVDIAQKQREKLITVFESENVKYFIKPMRWVDVYGDPTVAKCHSRDELTELFKECSVRCRTILNGKLYFCAIDRAAKSKGFVPESVHDYVDLTQNVDEQIIKESILKLDAGKIAKGYVNFCMNCYGGTDSNNRIIPVAEQM